MSNLVATGATDRAKPLGFAPAVLSIFISRAVAATLVRMIWLALPLYGGWSSFGGWNSYVILYSLLVSILAALGIPVLLRLFRYEVSYAAALIALFAGDIAAIFVYKSLIGHASRSPYLLVPSRSAFGAIGLIVSLLLSALILQLVANRRPPRVDKDRG